MKGVDYMARDQYGETYHALGPYPRKELLERLGYSHASRMFRTVNGADIHIGYVIGDRWCEIYRVLPWKGAL